MPWISRLLYTLSAGFLFCVLLCHPRFVSHTSGIFKVLFSNFFLSYHDPYIFVSILQTPRFLGNCLKFLQLNLHLRFFVTSDDQVNILSLTSLFEWCSFHRKVRDTCEYFPASFLVSSYTLHFILPFSSLSTVISSVIMHCDVSKLMIFELEPCLTCMSFLVFRILRFAVCQSLSGGFHGVHIIVWIAYVSRDLPGALVKWSFWWML